MNWNAAESDKKRSRIKGGKIMVKKMGLKNPPEPQQRVPTS